MTNAIARLHLPHFEAAATIRTDNATYRVVEPLGRGGNSVVYLVVRTSGEWQGLLFAMKIFVKVDQPERQQRFMNEVSFLKSADHPAIVRVFDAGSFTDPAGPQNVTFPYVIAEYLPQTLRTAMGRGLTMAEKVAYTLQLISALGYLEKREPPLTHRDIKPENIFIRGRSCILGDFGLLKELDFISGAENNDEKIDPPTAGKVGEGSFNIAGSEGVRFPYLYPTPDLLAYCKSPPGGYLLTTKSDVFQLGLVLAEVFTDSLPIGPRKSAYDPITLKVLGPIIGSQARGQAIKGLITAMLEEDRERRPSASNLFDSWEGIFLEVATESQRLNGRAF